LKSIVSKCAYRLVGLQKRVMENPKFTNALINSSSPYLLQHAHNPVNWQPWSEEALEIARTEKKPLLISIGYSACHWCHVMEHESFEDVNVAELMNANFVCIKVDREERPDIDQLYMLAVQLMSGQGGWPLNCFALPDGRPIYGGTYFPKENWKSVLNQIKNIFSNDYEKVLEYAVNLTNGIKQTELLKEKQGDSIVNLEDLKESVNKWMGTTDQEEGGPNRAPKFPLPNNYLFLLRYAHLLKQSHVLAYTHLTLKKMAFGGIYDQIGGGFARYSTDIYWKVPHFEKMLYDNGQLLSLYSEAYLQNKDDDYKSVCFQTTAFIQRELSSGEGYFYSALDADSEGVEGKYYVWKKEELIELLSPSEFKCIEVYYSVNPFGLWEDGNYILLRRDENSIVSEILEIDENELVEKVNLINAKLLVHRAKRIRPGLDDKLITSWNGMMVRGLADSARVFENEEMLQMAIKAARFIQSNLQDVNGRLFHSWKNGKAKIHGFLEDYAFLIDAYIGLYEANYDESWLIEARNLLFTVLDDFSQTTSGLFYFTSNLEKEWVTRQIETSDNVQPASNSMMARNLHRLSIYFGKPEWTNHAQKMLKTIREELIHYGAGYSNWGMLVLDEQCDKQELIITGKDAIQEAKRLRKTFHPNFIIAAAESNSTIDIFKGRFQTIETQYYLCKGNVCEAPSSEFNF
jgi:uncharacterized protein